MHCTYCVPGAQPVRSTWSRQLSQATSPWRRKSRPHDHGHVRGASHSVRSSSNSSPPVTLICSSVSAVLFCAALPDQKLQPAVRNDVRRRCQTRSVGMTRTACTSVRPSTMLLTVSVGLPLNVSTVTSNVSHSTIASVHHSCMDANAAVVFVPCSHSVRKPGSKCCPFASVVGTLLGYSLSMGQVTEARMLVLLASEYVFTVITLPPCPSAVSCDTNDTAGRTTNSSSATCAVDTGTATSTRTRRVLVVVDVDPFQCAGNSATLSSVHVLLYSATVSVFCSVALPTTAIVKLTLRPLALRRCAQNATSSGRSSRCAGSGSSTRALAVSTRKPSAPAQKCGCVGCQVCVGGPCKHGSTRAGTSVRTPKAGSAPEPPM